ncbi:MAG: GHKL domain-containing protein [Longicatena sp.]
MKETEIQKLINYLEHLLLFPTKQIEQPIIKTPSLLQLLDRINELQQCIKEVWETSNRLAEGNLRYPIRSQNHYGDGLKDLQASLKYLIYQLNQIAQGDYTVKMNFLGDFTETFKNLIMQLKEREDILKENARLNEKLAKRQEQLLESELQRSSDKYNSFVNFVMDIRRYRHDMQNHLLCMSALLQNNDYQGVKEYIESLMGDFPKTDVRENCLNYMLNALLYEKLKNAEEIHVKVNKRVIIDRKLNISNKDWCIIIGNALDNSLEALKRVEITNRSLSLEIIQKQDKLSIKISNTMLESIKIINNRVETIKEDRVNHGLGLQNIEKTVHKYQGAMKIETDENTFTLILLLMNI